MDSGFRDHILELRAAITGGRISDNIQKSYLADNIDTVAKLQSLYESGWSCYCNKESYGSGNLADGLAAGLAAASCLGYFQAYLRQLVSAILHCLRHVLARDAGPFLYRVRLPRA